MKSDLPVATTLPVVFAQPDKLMLKPADDPEAGGKDAAPNNEASGQTAKPEFAKFAREMHRLCNDKIGPRSIDFSSKSYIVRKRGNRAWLPMWPREEGAYVYVPGGEGGTPDQPSNFHAEVKDELVPLGVEPSWSFKYNAGANPIALTVALQNALHSKALQILTEAYALARQITGEEPPRPTGAAWATKREKEDEYQAPRGGRSGGGHACRPPLGPPRGGPELNRAVLRGDTAHARTTK